MSTQRAGLQPRPGEKVGPLAVRDALDRELGKSLLERQFHCVAEADRTIEGGGDKMLRPSPMGSVAA